MNTLTIARFTIQEAISRRLILAGVVISLAYIALFSLGFAFAYSKAVENATTVQNRLLVGVAIATLTVLGLYIVYFLGAFLALFLAVGSISGEIDSGTLHAVLARPIRRAEFVLGRWLAYACMMVVYVSAMVGLVLLVARLIAGFELPDPLTGVGLMVLGSLLLMTLSLFGSAVLSTLANGVIVFTMLGLSWLGGIIEYVGLLLSNAPDQTGSSAMINLGTAVSLLIPSDALWRGASYHLQSPTMLAATGAARGGIPFLSGTPIPAAMLLWSVLYVGIFLVGAVLAFQRRDL